MKSRANIGTMGGVIVPMGHLASISIYIKTGLNPLKKPSKLPPDLLESSPDSKLLGQSETDPKTGYLMMTETSSILTTF